jgi:hypothetical protein
MLFNFKKRPEQTRENKKGRIWVSEESDERSTDD